MRWRRVAMSAVAVLVACAMTFAQGRDEGPRGGDRGPRGDRGGDRMGPRGEGFGDAVLRQALEPLNLTDEQKQKLDELKADFDKKSAEMRAKAQASMEELRKFREENPDDREGLQKKRQELMEKNGAPMREAYQGYVEEIKGVLNEEQLKKFNDLMAQRAGEAGRMIAGGVGMMLLGLNPQAARDLNLTPEQQEKVRGLSEKFSDELKQLVTKYQGLIKEGLTPEQQAKFEKTMQEAQDRMRERAGFGQGGPGGRRGDRGDRPGRGGGDRPGRPGGEGDAPPPPPKPEGEPR